MEQLAVEPEHAAELRAAQPHGIADDRVEYRLNVGLQLRHDAQRLRRGGALSERLLGLVARAAQLDFPLLATRDVGDPTDDLCHSTLGIAHADAAIQGPSVPALPVGDAVLVLQMRHAPLEVLDDRPPVALVIIGVNAAIPIGGRQWLGRKGKERPRTLGEEERIAFEVPLVDAGGGNRRRKLIPLLAVLQRLLGAPLLRDVGVSRDETPARQRLAADRDHRAVGPHTFERVRLESSGEFQALPDMLLDGPRAVLATLRVEAKRLRHVEAASEELRRKTEQIDEPPVERDRVEVLVDHGDALVDVLERRLEDRLLRGELALAFLELGDVAGGSDHAHCASAAVAQRDAMRARPAPTAVRAAKAIVAFEPRRQTLEVGDMRGAKCGEIVRVNALEPVVPRLERLGRESEVAMDARR